MTSSSTIEAIVDDYFSAWNATDTALRRRSLEASCTPDMRYVDPQYDVHGNTEHEALLAGFPTRFPGHRFRRASPIDYHHDRARWSWELIGPDGATVVVSGMDFALLADDGRLREVTGFYAPPTPTSTQQ